MRRIGRVRLDPCDVTFYKSLPAAMLALAATGDAHAALVINSTYGTGVSAQARDAFAYAATQFEALFDDNTNREND